MVESCLLNGHYIAVGYIKYSIVAQLFTGYRLFRHIGYLSLADVIAKKAYKKKNLIVHTTQTIFLYVRATDTIFFSLWSGLFREFITGPPNGSVLFSGCPLSSSSVTLPAGGSGPSARRVGGRAAATARRASAVTFRYGRHFVYSGYALLSVPNYRPHRRR